MLLADDLADESRQGLQVTQEALQLGLQHSNPLLHVLLPLVQVRYHVIHDVLSLEEQRGNTLSRITVTLVERWGVIINGPNGFLTKPVCFKLHSEFTL